MENKKPKQSYDAILQNKTRSLILNLCKNPKSISELEKELRLNRGTLKHHIKTLEERGFVNKTYLKNTHGKPAQIKTMPQNIETIDKESKVLLEKEVEQTIQIYSNEMIELITFIKKKGIATEEEIKTNTSFNWKHKFRAIFGLLKKNYIGLSITPEGEKYLFEHNVYCGTKRIKDNKYGGFENDK